MGTDRSARECDACNTKFCGAENIKNGNFFIYIPVEQQITSLLLDPKLFNHLTNRDVTSLLNMQSINDITTAQLYQELLNKHNFNGNDISLTWNTDGVSVFNSSKYSIWPLQASVNELPPHLRKENMLLLGLWFGDKPCMNSYLKPFVLECKHLQEDGMLFVEMHQHGPLSEMENSSMASMAVTGVKPQELQFNMVTVHQHATIHTDHLLSIELQESKLNMLFFPHHKILSKELRVCQSLICYLPSIL